jgi:hypothetical protein
VLDDRQVVAVAVAARHANGAGQHHEHSGTALARADHMFAVAITMDRAEAPQPLDLRGRERGKRLVVA